jgi:beta-mannosidase
MDFTGNTFWRDSGKVDLSTAGSAAFYPFMIADMLNSVSEYRVFFKMELMLNGKTISENAYYFVKPKDLLLDKTEIQFSIQPGKNNSYTISLNTNSLAKNVCIDFGDLNVSLSNNFFDLFPREQKIISIVSAATLEKLKEKIKIKSLVDSY